MSNNYTTIPAMFKDVVLNNPEKSMNNPELLNDPDLQEKELSVIYVWYTEEGELIKLQFKSPEDNTIIEYKRTI